MFNHGRPGVGEKVTFLVDSSVNKSIVREEDWEKLRISANGLRKLNLKKNKTKFKTYSTGSTLDIIGRSKCTVQAECGKRFYAILYVVRGA